MRYFKLSINQYILAPIFGRKQNNTIFVIILTAIIVGLANQVWILLWLVHNYILVLLFLGLCTVICFLLSKEKKIKIKLNDKSLIEKWDNNEKKQRWPTIAVVNEDSLYLQLCDIPFTYDQDFTCPYALEFKTKVVNGYSAWCVNMRYLGDGENDMQGYMFQYDPKRKKLRPHVFLGYDSSKKQSKWISPEDDNSPFSPVENFVLKERKGWYSIRTEVYSREAEINRQFDGKELESLKVPIFYEGRAEIEYVNYSKISTELNRYILIRIYDKNNFYKNVFDVVFCTYPSIYIPGKRIGFRNAGFEAAYYKDIRIIKLLDREKKLNLLKSNNSKLIW